MKRIKQYGAATVVAALLVLSGCSSSGPNNKSVPNSVLLTKPFKMDALPDLGVGAVPSPQSAPVANSGTNTYAALADERAGAQYRCGNEPVYTLNGNQYTVLPSALGYRAEGMATRYSAQYQGSATAGCEKYDLHAFTAAHRTLPLPSFVRVTNLQNNKVVIVKVNDRGPFDGGGLIRLSSAAASTLGIRQGVSASVRIEGINSPGAVRAAAPVSRSQATAQQAQQPARPVQRADAVQAAAVQKAKQSGKSFFVVVKNYPSQMDALDMFVRLTSVGLKNTELASAVSDGRQVHQVRVGPLYTQDQIDSVKNALSSNGLATFKVVEVDQ